MKAIVYQPPSRYPGLETIRGDALPGLSQVLERAGYTVVPLETATSASGEQLASEVEMDGDVRLWVTARLCPHAADLLGPQLSQQHQIPYVLWEPLIGPGSAELASVSEKTQAKAALLAAQLTVTTCSYTAQGLSTLIEDPQRLVRIPPFADLAECLSASHLRDTVRAGLASRLGFSDATLCLVTDGSQEPAAVQTDWEMLVLALSRLVVLDWRLIVLGSEPPNAAVQSLLLRLPRDRVHCWQVARDSERLQVLAGGDLYVWPACSVNAWPTLLKAQACGTPVVACHSEAVADRVLDGQTGRLAAANAESFANAISFLTRHRSFLSAWSTQAREVTATRHDLRVAAHTLRGLLNKLVRGDKA